MVRQMWPVQQSQVNEHILYRREERALSVLHRVALDEASQMGTDGTGELQSDLYAPFHQLGMIWMKNGIFWQFDMRMVVPTG